MKLKVIFFLFFISSLSYSQNSEIYLELNDQILVNSKNATMGVFEFSLKIKNSQNGDEDYYTFIANLDGEKSFEDNGVEIPATKYITIGDLKLKTSCELHDYLSKSRINFVKITNSKCKRWFAVYTGTHRNLVVSKTEKL